MKYKLLLLFALAFILRLFLIPMAHHGDLNNNISWGQEVLLRGFDGFYGSSDANDWPYSAPNQPPLYILLFGGLVWLYQRLDLIIHVLNENIGIFPSSFVWYWEIQGMDLMVKLPGIVADLGIASLLFYYCKRKDKFNDGFLLSAIWLFNPVTWYSSAIWGQTDTLVNLIGLFAIFSLLNVFKFVSKFGRLQWFSFWFTLSLLFKPSLTILLPVLAVYILKSKFTVREYITSALISVFLITATSIWFHPYASFPVWFIELYADRILPGEIGYLTANAFNFWWLVDSGKVLDNTLYFGLSARLWSLILTIGGLSIMCIWLYLKLQFDIRKAKNKTISNHKLTNKFDTHLFLALTTSSLVTFLFLTRIHERYLFPFFPFATLLIFYSSKFKYIYVLASLIHLLNLYHLFWAPPIPILETVYSYDWFPSTLSVVMIVIFLCVMIKIKSSDTWILD